MTTGWRVTELQWANFDNLNGFSSVQFSICKFVRTNKLENIRRKLSSRIKLLCGTAFAVPKNCGIYDRNENVLVDKFVKYFESESVHTNRKIREFYVSVQYAWRELLVATQQQKNTAEKVSPARIIHPIPSCLTNFNICIYIPCDTLWYVHIYNLLT